MSEAPSCKKVEKKILTYGQQNEITKITISSVTYSKNKAVRKKKVTVHPKERPKQQQAEDSPVRVSNLKEILIWKRQK